MSKKHVMSQKLENIDIKKIAVTNPKAMGKIKGYYWNYEGLPLKMQSDVQFTVTNGLYVEKGSSQDDLKKFSFKCYLDGFSDTNKKVMEIVDEIQEIGHARVRENLGKEGDKLNSKRLIKEDKCGEDAQKCLEFSMNIWRSYTDDGSVVDEFNKDVSFYDQDCNKLDVRPSNFTEHIYPGVKVVAVWSFKGYINTTEIGDSVMPVSLQIITPPDTDNAIKPVKYEAPATASDGGPGPNKKRKLDESEDLGHDAGY